MDWTQRLTHALDYLEDHLERPVDMEHAASLANCSLFHFCRMFEVVFGTSPGEYVRRRRLSRAALDLAASDAKVIDVALRYGYDSPEAFAKAFKRCFGITPSDARAGVTLETWPPARVAVVLQGGTRMKYRIVEKPAFRVVGKILRTTSAENENLGSIPAFWNACHADGTVRRLCAIMGPMGILGVCGAYHTEDNSFDYVVSVEAPAGSVPADLSAVDIPAATYVVFDSHGPMPTAIQAVWRAAYAEWFPASGYEHAGTPDFEVYPPYTDSRGDPASPDCHAEVWIPIRKKA